MVYDAIEDGSGPFMKEYIMQIQAINQPIQSFHPLTTAGSGKISTTTGSVASNKNAYDATNSDQMIRALLSEKYSVKNTTASFANKDGDTVSISTSSIDYQTAITTANQDSSPESWQKIIDNIKDEYVKMKGAIVAEMFGNEEEKAPVASDPRAFDEATEIPGLPEYWNAENTAQRIADFATSFAGMFKGSDEEFVNMMKDAIDEGFSQAKDILGNLPDPVGKLSAKTHALVMDKIDQWASDRAAAAQSVGVQSAATGV
jgi:hypothetical protein